MPRNHHQYDIRRKYGMTLDEYDAMLELQGNHCALCLTTPEENGRRLSVDHDHSCCPGTRSCGKCVRGLLCYRCNTCIEWYLGLPDETVLVKYLKENN